jgi:hypothetical protein
MLSSLVVLIQLDGNVECRREALGIFAELICLWQEVSETSMETYYTRSSSGSYGNEGLGLERERRGREAEDGFNLQIFSRLTKAQPCQFRPT